jgi:hypothetical protein
MALEEFQNFSEDIQSPDMDAKLDIMRESNIPQGLSAMPGNRPEPSPPIPVFRPQMAMAPQQMPVAPPEISPVEKAKNISVSEILAPLKADLIEIFFRKAGGNPEMVVSELMGNAARDYQGLPPSPASSGGLIEMSMGGDFRGRVPGDGHGMEDNVFMPIQEGPKQVGTLAVSPKEYVVDAHTMSALGNGNADKGADVMDKVVENVRHQAYGTIKQPREINGLAALRPMTERV